MKVGKSVIKRIDQVIKDNKRHEMTVIIMAIIIFLVGVSALVAGIYFKNAFIIAPSVIITGFLYWPINKILRIRKENIMLGALPALISTLEPEEAAKELSKLLEKIYDRKE